MSLRRRFGRVGGTLSPPVRSGSALVIGVFLLPGFVPSTSSGQAGRARGSVLLLPVACHNCFVERGGLERGHFGPAAFLAETNFAVGKERCTFAGEGFLALGAFSKAGRNPSGVSAVSSAVTHDCCLSARLRPAFRRAGRALCWVYTACFESARLPARMLSSWTRSTRFMPICRVPVCQ